MTRHSASLAPVSGLAIVSHGVRVVLRQLSSIVKALAHRRQVLNLAELDDRALKDIGLSRGDVEGALAEPFHRDPTMVLVRTHEHRARLQAVTPGRSARPVVAMRPGPSRG